MPKETAHFRDSLVMSDLYGHTSSSDHRARIDTQRGFTMSEPHLSPGSAWLHDLEQRAEETLDRAVFDWLVGGSGREESLAGARQAWTDVLLSPDAGVDVSVVDTSTTLLGMPVAAPVGVAPTGFHGLIHERAESATSRACEAAGLLFALSSRASLPFDAVARPGSAWWFQPYVLRDRRITEDQVRAAVALGASALVLTVDAPVLASRRQSRDASLVSPKMLAVNTVYAADANGLEQSPTVTAGDVGWLAGLSGLPVIVKGVTRPDTAMTFVREGAAAIWVSNHGGRQLDGCLPPARALPAVADRIGEQAEVYVDGGIRSGVDVLRALALGARAAFVGRPPLLGLAVAGETGVGEVLERLVDEFRVAMQLVGRTTVPSIGRDLVWAGSHAG